MKPITLSQFTKRYRIKQKIGSGSFGDVYRIQDINTKRQLALKKIQLRKNESLQQFLREIQIQHFLAHPLVVKIFEFYLLQAQNHYLGKKLQIGIVMELGNNSLEHVIKNQNQNFPVQEIINFAFHFIKLFAYFQDQNIVHRDIKPQNFIQFGEGLQCKLIDFGLCTHVNDIRTLAGSFHYFSPKLKKLHYNPKLKLKTNPYKDDVYSFGLTLYEIIIRSVGHASNRWGNRGLSREVFHYTKSNQLTDIIQLMLEDDEQKRPDFIQLFEIFNEKFTFYQEDQYEQSRHSETMIMQKPQSQQQIFNISVDETLSKRQNLVQQQKISTHNEEIRRTYKQELVYQNTEYEFRTIKDVEKENYVDCQNQNDILFDEDYSISNNQQYLFGQQCVQKEEYNNKFEQSKYEHEKLQVEGLSQSRIFSIQPQMHAYQNNQQNVQQPIDNEKNLGYKRRNYHLGSKVVIRSILIIKEFIICGCEDGSLYVHNTEAMQKKDIYKVEGTKHHHSKAITVMGKDQWGRLWTGSEDSLLLIWDRPKFFKHLIIEKYYHEKTIECVDKKGQRYTKIHNYIEMDPEAAAPIQLPYHHEKGISSLYCQDDLNFVVGYNDGCVFTVWNNNEAHYQTHQNAVTSIQIYQGHLFTASIDGNIKVFGLENMSLVNISLTTQLPIRSFKISGELQNPNFLIVTADYRAYIVPGWTMTLQEAERIPGQLDITAAIFVNELIFSIAKNGNFMRDGCTIEKCKGEGWTCLDWNGQNMMVMGSTQGQLVLIKSK